MTINVTRDEFWEILAAINDRSKKLSGEIVEEPYHKENELKSKQRLWLKQVEKKMTNIIWKGCKNDK